MAGARRGDKRAGPATDNIRDKPGELVTGVTASEAGRATQEDKEEGAEQIFGDRDR